MEPDHEACYRALSTRDARFDGRFFIAVRTTRIVEAFKALPDINYQPVRMLRDQEGL